MPMTQPTGATIDVRPVTKDDIAALSVHDPYPGAAAERFEATSEDSVFVAAWRANEPIAWGILDVSDEELVPLLTHLWVFPEARRQGVGKFLTNHLQEMARERGFTEIFMLVDPEREASAIPMYLDLEFSPTGDHRLGQVVETGERTHQAIYRHSLAASR